MIFKLYIFYNKHDDDENGRSNQRKTANIIGSARITLLPIVCKRKKELEQTKKIAY